MRVLITGGDGFIGSHVAEELLIQGHDVVLLDLKFGNNSRELACRKLLADITDPSSLSIIPKDVELLIHLAAISRVEEGERDPHRCLNVNVGGTLNLLRLITERERRPHLLFSSSRDVYGEPLYMPVDESHPRSPLSIYGISKSTCEDLIQHFHRTHGVNFTILRLSNVYGSVRDVPHRVIPTWVTKALRNEPIYVYGAEKMLDFVFINDVVNAILRVVKKIEDDDERVNNVIMNICSGIGTQLLELAKKIKRLCDSYSQILLREPKNYEVKRFVGSYHKARLIIGFECRTSLEEGLKKYINEVVSSMTL